MNRGEVWWYEEEGAKRRPYLVLTRDEAIPVLDEILGAPATRTARNIPTEVPLDESDGMPAPCALTLDNIRPILTSLCTRRITQLDAHRMAMVCEALVAATGCRPRHSPIPG